MGALSLEADARSDLPIARFFTRCLNQLAEVWSLRDKKLTQLPVP